MKTLLEAVLDLTDRVQAAIDAGDWAAANELETLRRAQLEKLILAGDGAVPLTGVLDAIQQRTYKLIGLVEHHRRRVLREATTVTTGHAAAARYAEQGANR
jgi:hypothetical protein